MTHTELIQKRISEGHRFTAESEAMDGVALALAAIADELHQLTEVTCRPVMGPRRPFDNE